MNDSRRYASDLGPSGETSVEPRDPFRLAMRESVDGMALLDVEHRITFVNPAMARLCELDGDAGLEGCHWEMLLGIEALHWARGVVLPEVSRTGAWSGVLAVSGGGARPVELDSTLSALPDHTTLWVARARRDGSSDDENASRYRHMVESTNTLLCFVDSDYVIRNPNPAFRRYFGGLEGRGEAAALPELIGERAFVSIAKGDLGRCLDGQPVRVQRTIEHLGEPSNLEIQLDPYRTPDGAITGVVVSMLDVTDRIRAEDALRQSEARFRNLIEGSLQGVLIHRDGLPLFVNRSVVDMFGFNSTDEVFALTDIEELAATHERKRLREYAERRRRGSIVPAQYEFEGVRRDGSRVDLLNSVRVVNWYGVPAVQSTLIDITSKKSAEKERERLIEELEARNVELERFNYTVSHDLRSPLITIRGFVGLLEEDIELGERERIKEDLAQIHDAAGRMQALLHDLLQLSKVGKSVNTPTWISLSEVVGDALSRVEGTYDAATTHIAVASALPSVKADPVRLVEVFQNLVENAIKFGRPDSPVSIEIGIRDNNAARVYYVRDNGIGVEPCYHAKIFELFERLDAHTGGTGIGLAIVRRIIEGHGGRIWVESPAGEPGATFCFTLPGAP